MERYSVIHNKCRREIVLLRGSGCKYARCTFCDYHNDRCTDEKANFALNSEVLARVTGIYGDLEVINSGSVFELDTGTLSLIKETACKKGVKRIHFESHWLYRDKIAELRQYFEGISLKLKLGLETFDADFRENVLHKGIASRDPDEICRGFDEANFLFGLRGQFAESMERDILLGLEHFERVCVNVMCPNSTPVKPDYAVIDEFMRKIYPRYRDNERVDILIQNTDFGVGD